MRRLPGLLREIADATDLATALAIAHAKGGQRVYVATFPDQANWLSELVGLAAARRIGATLCPAQGGLDLDIPIGSSKCDDRKAEVEKLTLAGIGKMKIAEAMGLHYRTIQRYRSALRAEGRIPEPNGQARPRRAPPSRNPAKGKAHG